MQSKSDLSPLGTSVVGIVGITLFFFHADDGDPRATNLGFTGPNVMPQLDARKTGKIGSLPFFLFPISSSDSGAKLSFVSKACAKLAGRFSAASGLAAGLSSFQCEKVSSGN